ncbi:6-bladed beta-propeller [Faecalicatena contorta]|uniref:6-bladed beta-propeller protein n=1 Tax=Faecalicatena contorta TaxID=39482 RepID=A0A315ZVW2_9FIRM|nr:6-bladed beta-propeller [Faecalicatena contorta]PWJ49771.1 6-bladed beta-propeller protein [Faecalicatena contorta]SUQ14489.1 6-bladed beta-propeller protein [Faecalicatena contorta]
MRKQILLCLLIMIIFSMSACNSGSELYKEMIKESEDYILPIEDAKEIDRKVEEDLSKFTHIYKDNYKVEKLKIDGVDNPVGILCREQDILITDRENDRLVVTDFEGNVIRKIGETGNGPLEFMSPGEIIRYENKVYILDEKNYRVQILDENLNYVEEIKTKHADPNDPHFVYQNMAISKKGIYLNGFSFTSDQVHLYTAGTTEPIVIGKNFYGPLYNYQEKIYAMNTSIKTYLKKDDSLSYRGGGDNYLFLVNDEIRDFELKCSVMSMTDTTSFLINEAGIVALSVGNASLFTFEMDGRYTSTVAIMEGLDEEVLGISGIPNFSVSSAGDYYVTSPKNGIIFRCSPEE